MSSFDLEAWAAKSRMSPFPKAKQPGDLVLLSDMESVVVLAHRVGNYVVETSDRGGPRKLIGSFSTEDNGLRTLIYWIGSGASGRDPGARDDLSGTTVDDSPIAVHLSWPRGSAEFGPGITGKLWARRFNWTRERSPQQVADYF